jgi:hypothetical protein
MAKEKKEKVQLWLQVTEKSDWSFGEHYYHQYARVVTQKFEDRHWVPYGVDDTYGDGPFYSYLTASCQGDEKSALRSNEPVYGIDVEYREMFTVDLRKAKRMVKTLELIRRGLDKLTAQRGYTRSWGEYLGRLAEVLGCEGLTIQLTANSESVRGYRWEWYANIGEGVNAANSRVWQWQQEVKKRLQPAPADSEVA